MLHRANSMALFNAERADFTGADDDRSEPLLYMHVRVYCKVGLGVFFPLYVCPAAQFLWPSYFFIFYYLFKLNYTFPSWKGGNGALLLVIIVQNHLPMFLVVSCKVVYIVVVS